MIKTYQKAITRGLLALSLTGLLSCGNRTKDIISQHELFNGDVKITMTETTQDRGLDTWVYSVKLDFEINQPGDYLFEGWQENHRAPDSLNKRWEYQINEVPSKEEKYLNKIINRFEATRVVKNNRIERDTEKFEYHGLINDLIIPNEQK